MFFWSNLWYCDPLFQSSILLFLSYYLILEKIGFPSFDLLWHCFYSLHSSSFPHLLSPFLGLHSVLPFFFTLSYLSEVYFTFQYRLVCLTPHFALFFWLCRLLVTIMPMKTIIKCKQWWKHVPFHTNSSFSHTTVSLFSCRTSVSESGNSHQFFWQNFPAFFSGVHLSNATTEFPRRNSLIWGMFIQEP